MYQTQQAPVQCQTVSKPAALNSSNCLSEPRVLKVDPLGARVTLQNGECIDHSFTLDNRGKQSIAVNLADPQGQQIVRGLAAKADVFLTNLLPVRLGRFGLDYPTIDGTNPRIVYASVSGWGLDGPDPDRLAFDMTAFFARGGIMSMWGQPNSPPVKPRSGQGDHQTGLAAFSSILAALLLRVSSEDAMIFLARSVPSLSISRQPETVA